MIHVEITKITIERQEVTFEGGGVSRTMRLKPAAIEVTGRLGGEMFRGTVEVKLTEDERAQLTALLDQIEERVAREVGL